MNEAQVAKLCADIQIGWNAQEWMATARQARIAGATQRLEHAHIDGVGEKFMSVDPYVFHSWGQRLGYQCWNDPGFRREMMRDNPETRVRSKSRKIQVGYGS